MQQYYSSRDWWVDSTHASDELPQSSLSSGLRPLLSRRVRMLSSHQRSPTASKPSQNHGCSRQHMSHLKVTFGLCLLHVQKSNSLQRKWVKWYKKPPPNCRVIDLLSNDIVEQNGLSHPLLPCFSSVRWGCEGLMEQWADQMFRISSHFKQLREGMPTWEDKERGL